MQIQTWHTDALASLPLESCGAMAQLFHNTIHQINRRDYSPEQIATWSPQVRSAAAWQSRLRQKQALYLAWNEEPLRLTGFAELDPASPSASAHIDGFYVHHQWQGQGVGSALLTALEADAVQLGISLLYVEASITAQPFFSRKGFRVIREQFRTLGNCQFKQFYLEKPLGGS
jgi:putative acetyltransferase